MARKILSACLHTALALGTVSMFGCGSTGTERAAGTVETSELLQNQFDALKGKIDLAVQALEGVVGAASGGDLEGAFEKYVTELGNLDTQAEAVVATAKDLRARTQAYLDGWEEQMASVESAALKEHVAKRREEAEKQFDEISDELEQIGENYRSFVKNLNEIKIVLENDLNPRGVGAIASIVTKAKEESGPVKEDIDTIKAGLDKIRAAFSSSAPTTTG